MIAPDRLQPAPATRLGFEEARAAMLALARALPPETLDLEAAPGRVLAQTLTAEADLVPFARSAMDGYALRAADTASATAETPLSLAVVGASYAGDTPADLAPGTARAIATGAALPAGADAVVPFERVERDGETIRLTEPLAARDHVFEPGDDAKAGDVLARAGDRITPGIAALLAAAGCARVEVVSRPRVALLSTGGEIVAVTATPAPGQIRNSNAAMLAAALEADGARVVSVAHAPDVATLLESRLREALASADLVITTGGASAGERDYVKRVVRALGGDFAFESVAMRPSRPTAFARCGDALVAVLPGNPAAAYVAYAALVRGVVRALGGRGDMRPPRVRATLDGRVRRKPERHFLMFARLAFRDGRFVVRELENQCSSLVRTAADANALIVVEPGTEVLTSGDAVDVEVLDWNAVPFAASSAC
jgi:molybdopterin molybdotransferase